MEKLPPSPVPSAAFEPALESSSVAFGRGVRPGSAGIGSYPRLDLAVAFELVSPVAEPLRLRSLVVSAVLSWDPRPGIRPAISCIALAGFCLCLPLTLQTSFHLPPLSLVRFAGSW